MDKIDYEDMTPEDENRILGDLIVDKGRKLTSNPNVWDVIYAEFSEEILNRWAKEVSSDLKKYKPSNRPALYLNGYHIFAEKRKTIWVATVFITDNEWREVCRSISLIEVKNYCKEH